MGIGGKRMDMEIEDKSSLPKGCINYSESDFAKNMNCPKSMIQWVDDLTNKIFSNPTGKSNFKGNIGCRYCGRYYSVNGGTDNVFVGLKFERPVGHKLVVGFCVKAPKTNVYPKKEYINVQKLLSAHYNYYAEYTEIDGGYWFYIFIDDYLFCCKDSDSAALEIKKVLKDVLGEVEDNEIEKS